MMTEPTFCPVCHKPATDPGTLPFCTERCRKTDFFRWWDGRYAIREPLEEGFGEELRNDAGDGDGCAEAEADN